MSIPERHHYRNVLVTSNTDMQNRRNHLLRTTKCPFSSGGSEGVQCTLEHILPDRFIGSFKLRLCSPGSKDAVAELAKASPRGAGNRRKRKLPARSGA